MRLWYPRVFALSALLIALPGGAGLGADSGRKPKEFSDGIKAQDKEDWRKSAELLSKAANEQPDDGAPTRIYGTRFEPYLPFYFLGLALYKQGKCEEALVQWEKCLQRGAVQQTEENELLRLYQAACGKGKTSVLAAPFLGGERRREASAGPRNQIGGTQRLQTDQP